MKKNPPSHLSKESAAWWDKILRAWDLDDSALLILALACESFDRMRGAQALVTEHGILVDDRFGQKRMNPAVLVERDNRAAMLQALKALCLDLEPLQSVGRPPRR